jgi:hypothetical protein
MIVVIAAVTSTAEIALRRLSSVRITRLTDIPRSGKLGGLISSLLERRYLSSFSLSTPSPFDVEIRLEGLDQSLFVIT